MTALFDGVDTLNVSLSGAGDQAYVSYDGTNIDVGTTNGGNDVYDGTDPITKIVVTDTGAAANQTVTFSGSNAIPATITSVQSTGIESAVVSQVILSTTVTGDAGVVQVDAPGQIQDGIGLAASGATVSVGAGTFDESVTINKSLALHGAQQGIDGRSGLRTGLPATETVVRGAASGPLRNTAFTVSVNDVVIDGFTVQDVSNGNVFGAAIWMQPTTNGTELRNNIIQNNLVGVFVANNSNSNQTVIEKNLFRNNTLSGPASGHDIYADEYTAGVGMQNVLIDNNKFTNTAMTVNAWALGLSNTNATSFKTVTFSNNDVSNHGRGLYMYNTDGVVVQGNTIAGTTNYAVGVFTAFGTDKNANVDILGNTLTGNDRGIYLDGYTGTLDVSGNSITGGNIAFDIFDADGFATLNLTDNTVTGNTTGGTINSVTTINLDTNSFANTVDVNAGSVGMNQFGVGGQMQAVGYSNVVTFDVDLLAGADTVNVKPHASTLIDLDGGANVDTLNYFSDGVNAFNVGTSVITTATKANINYVNFEAVNVAGNLLIPGTGLDDILDVTATSANGGSYVLTTNGVPGPSVGLVGVTKLTFDAQGGNDKLIVRNPAGGVFGPTSGIYFQGGSESDELDVVGGSSSTGGYTPGPTADAGVVTHVNGPTTQTINFTGLEPIVDTTPTTTFSITGTSGVDTINLVNGVVAFGSQTIEVNFDGAFEKILLANKGTVDVDTGLGADVFHVNFTVAPTGVTTVNLKGGNDANAFYVDSITPATPATNLRGGANSDSFFLTSAGQLTGSIFGGGANDFLYQADGTNSWTISGGNSGTVTDVSGSFSGVEYLMGGTDSDSFTFTNAGSLSGTIDGNSGSDTVKGDADGNSFLIDGADSGSLATKVSSFVSIENVAGGTSADTFAFPATGSLSGTLDGAGSGGDLLDYSSRNTSVSVDLTSGTATSVGSGLVVGAGLDVGSSIENVYGGSAADTLIGDVDANTVLGNGGADTINAKAGVDYVDAGAGVDRIEVAGAEAEFDTIQGGPGGVGDATDYDLLINVGTSDVTLNQFNVTYNDFANSIDEYDGAGFGVLGNGNGNKLQFGFTKLTNVTGLNSGGANDEVTTSYSNNASLTADVVYDGGSGSDSVVLVFTPDQLGALTTADIGLIQTYLLAPTGLTLSLTADELKGNFTATNFENARLAAYDDDVIIDITSCFLAVVSENQIVVGTNANETITGTPQTDLIFGQDGNDTIDGLAAGDCIFGGRNNDSIVGGSGADLILGGSGNDTVSGGTEQDEIFGGSGDDTLYGDQDDDTITGGKGNDVAYGGQDEDWLYGSEGDDSLYGELGLDQLFGEAGSDYLEGGADNDTLNGGIGVDTVLGNAGVDKILVQGLEGEFDTFNGGTEFDDLEIIAGTGSAAINGFSVASNAVERILGNNQGLLGNANANVFNLLGVTFASLSPLTQVNALGGDDSLTGSAFNDWLIGGEGNDTILGNDGFDVLEGGNGNDSISGGVGNDTIEGGAGADSVNGDAGDDVIRVRGTDMLTDTVVNGGTNTDRIVNVGGTDVTLAAFNALTQSIEQWDGGTFGIVGTGVGNVFDFRTSATATTTFSASTLVFINVSYVDGLGGNDTIYGTNSVDNLRGGDGDDQLYGLNADDTLLGGNGNDLLSGGFGIDTLNGGDGADTLTGGSGNDLFVFADVAADMNDIDTITDYSYDVIDVSAYNPAFGVTYANISFLANTLTLTSTPGQKKIVLTGVVTKPAATKIIL